MASRSTLRCVRFPVRRFACFLALWIIACPASAEEPRWTANSLDPYGAVSYRDVVPRQMSTAQAQALDHLRAARYSQAWATFKTLYLKDDASPFHIWGMMLAADGAGRMKGALEVVASPLQAIRLRELAREVTTMPKAQAKHIVAFNLGLAVAKASERRVVNGPLAESWWTTLAFQPLPNQVQDRATIILYSCAMQVLGEFGQARPPLERLVARYPRDARLHYLLARLYSEGAVSIVERGKEIPVPMDQRPNPQLALRHALLAAKLEPNWADARFWAGLQQVVSNPNAAKEHFRAYLKLATPSPKRRALIDTFLLTGYWGPPRGGS